MQTTASTFYMLSCCVSYHLLHLQVGGVAANSFQHSHAITEMCEMHTHFLKCVSAENADYCIYFLYAQLLFLLPPPASASDPSCFAPPLAPPAEWPNSNNNSKSFKLDSVNYSLIVWEQYHIHTYIHSYIPVQTYIHIYVLCLYIHIT